MTPATPDSPLCWETHPHVRVFRDWILENSHLVELVGPVEPRHLVEVHAEGDEVGAQLARLAWECCTRGTRMQGALLTYSADVLSVNVGARVPFVLSTLRVLEWLLPLLTLREHLKEQLIDATNAGIYQWARDPHNEELPNAISKHWDQSPWFTYEVAYRSTFQRSSRAPRPDPMRRLAAGPELDHEIVSLYYCLVKMVTWDPLHLRLLPKVVLLLSRVFPAPDEQRSISDIDGRVAHVVREVLPLPPRNPRGSTGKVMIP